MPEKEVATTIVEWGKWLLVTLAAMVTGMVTFVSRQYHNRLNSKLDRATFVEYDAQHSAAHDRIETRVGVIDERVYDIWKEVCRNNPCAPADQGDD